MVSIRVENGTHDGLLVVKQSTITVTNSLNRSVDLKCSTLNIDVPGPSVFHEYGKTFDYVLETSVTRMVHAQSELIKPIVHEKMVVDLSKQYVLDMPASPALLVTDYVNERLATNGPGSDQPATVHRWG